MRTPPLLLRIKASPLLAMMLLLAHGGAIACALAYMPGWWIPGSTVAAIASSLVFHLCRDALQLSGQAVTELILKDDAQCELTLRNADTFLANIEGSTFVSPLLTVINVRPHGRGGRRAVVLMPDSAPAQDLRRVRVWLRHRVRPEITGSGTL
ncbi:MAG TPA: protein YgfX [Burkholderiales bacterium]|nr:protein YgfX [Burkholderiales bacterium]